MQSDGGLGGQHVAPEKSATSYELGAAAGEQRRLWLYQKDQVVFLHVRWSVGAGGEQVAVQWGVAVSIRARAQSHTTPVTFGVILRRRAARALRV